MSGIDTLLKQLASASVEDTVEEKEVSFAGRGLQLDTENDASEIVQAISSCPGMTTLRLEGNTMGIPASKAIAKALESQSMFKRALFKDMFTRRTENEIPHALGFLSESIIKSNANLTELDLSDNAFGPRGLKGVVGLLESSACYTLKELYVNNNGLGISGGKMLAEALCKCVSNSKRDGQPLNLKVFVCGRNRLENEGATAISNFLKAVGSLESVAMPQNGIYHIGVKQLSAAFACNTNLKSINLEDNTITEDGAKHLAKCLPSLQKIESINFGDCLLRTKGALILAETLKDSCPNLKQLYLGYNEIKIDGGKEIGKAMENKSSLEKVILNGNQFGDDGCEQLKAIMSQINKNAQLGSLSDDDGDEDEDEEDEEYAEEEEEEYDEGTSETEILDVSNDGCGDQPSTQHQSPMLKATLEDFVSNPTTESLIALEKSNLDFFTLLPPNPSIEDYMGLFMAITSVVKPGDEAAKSAAIKYADKILDKAFQLSGDDFSSQFNNDFLVALGLLKGENKKIKSVLDISGSFIVLQHCIQQSYFNASTRKLLEFFLSRPLTYVTASNAAKHALLQSLYKI